MYYFYDVKRARVGDVKRQRERERQTERGRATERAARPNSERRVEGTQRKVRQSMTRPDPNTHSQSVENPPAKRTVRVYVSDMTAAARSDNNWLRHSVGPLSFVCWLCCLLLAALCDVSTTNSSICECSCSSCKCLRIGVVVVVDVGAGAAAAQSIDKVLLGLCFSLTARALTCAALWHVRSRALWALNLPLTLCFSLTRSQQNSCSAYTKCKQTVKKL